MNRRKSEWYIVAIAVLAISLLATSASAAVTKVIGVPWEGNEIAYHQTWSGKTILLKAVVSTDNTSAISYSLDFGDGSPLVTGSVSGYTKYPFAAFHAYTGAVGTPFIATLTVSDGTHSLSDTYQVRIVTQDLDAERAVAVDDALWYLYWRQAANGSWTDNGWSSGYYANATASAVQAFEVNNHLQTGDPDKDPYVDAVRNGLSYLITTSLQAYAIGVQPYGNPDTNGNGRGIGVNSSRPIYEGGAVIDALINTRTPNADSGRDFDGDGANETYLEIVQDMCDMYAWGQGDAASGGYAGGWRYSWNADSDNSAAQWAAIGMIPAERTWGCTIPAWVKQRNDVWLNYSHQMWGTGNMYGGFGYTGSGNGIALTPCGMVQLNFIGAGRGDARWVRCERWFADNWTTGSNWLGNRNYYAFYAGFKAFTLATPEPIETFQSNGFNWYRGNATTMGLARRLIEDQDRSTTNALTRGRFHSNGGYVEYPLSTAFATIILSGFESQPVAVVAANPNPTDQDIAVTFDHSGSYHLDNTRNLTLFEYDWNDDGIFDYSTNDLFATPTHAFHCDTYPTTPCTFPVAMRVSDNSTPVRRNTAVINVVVTPPPHPPTANPGGPYLVCPGSQVTLDASLSTDIDIPLGDHIVSYAWELDGLAPYDFNDLVTTNPISTINPSAYGIAASGIHNIGLRVTDTAGLTHEKWTTISIDDDYCVRCVTNLTARAKSGKAQLVWTNVGAANYRIYRKVNSSPTYTLIGQTTSTYSTYLDLTAVSGITYSYYVQSVNAAGGTCNSDPVIITIPATR